MAIMRQCTNANNMIAMLRETGKKVLYFHGKDKLTVTILSSGKNMASTYNDIAINMMQMHKSISQSLIIYILFSVS